MEDTSGMFIGTAKVGPKGQIVIPKEVRELFGIGPGDSLLIMADRRRGIAIQKQSVMEKIADAIFEGRGAAMYPGEEPAGLATFAKAIKGARGKDGGKTSGRTGTVPPGGKGTTKGRAKR